MTTSQLRELTAQTLARRLHPIDDMQALTIMNPWVRMITAGDKRLENRTWRPPRTISGQRIAIHAGKAWSQAARGLLPVDRVEPDRSDCVFGAIIATAIVDGFVRSEGEAERVIAGQGRWFIGPCAWVLRDLRVLRNPVPCKGMQGVWRVPDDMLT